MTDSLEFVTYCGLYCELCAARARIPQRAALLQETMTDEGWPFWGREIPGFAPFWEFLQELQADGGCPGCRAGGGYPACPIRACARERGLELCSQCDDFACDHVKALAARYPTLRADNARLQKVGLEKWLAEQAQRVARGVVYADTRYLVEEPE